MKRGEICGSGRSTKNNDSRTRFTWVPYPRIWTAYDKEADVLYINFKKPSHADDSELTDDDTIIRYEKGEVIGFTILNASRKKLSKVKVC